MNLGKNVISLRRCGKANNTVGLTDNINANIIKSTKFPRYHTASSSIIAWNHLDCTDLALIFPKHYIPVFATQKLAQRVASWLPEIPQMHLDRKNTGSNQLRIAKTNKITRMQSNFTLHKMCIDEAMMIPFNANIGLLLPINLLSDNNREMIFECHIIEPAGYN